MAKKMKYSVIEISNIAFAIAATSLVWALYSVISHDVIFVGKFTHGIIHLHGISAISMTIFALGTSVSFSLLGFGIRKKESRRMIITAAQFPMYIGIIAFYIAIASMRT